MNSVFFCDCDFTIVDKSEWQCKVSSSSSQANNTKAGHHLCDFITLSEIGLRNFNQPIDVSKELDIFVWLNSPLTYGLLPVSSPLLYLSSNFSI